MNIDPQILASTSWKRLVYPRLFPAYFFPPPNSFLKLNFDWPYKASHGDVANGGLFRDPQSWSLHFYVVNYGSTTNNELEFNVVKHGILIARREWFIKLVIEGYSNLVIKVIKKSNHGNQWENISTSWRMESLFQKINEIIPYIDYIIPSHVL